MRLPNRRPRAFAAVAVALALYLLSPLSCIGGASAAVAGALDEEEGAREAAVKAAFLFNFAKFTDWPAEKFRSAAEPLTLCTGSSGRLHDALLVLTEKTINNRPVRVAALDRPAGIAGCHILFVDAATPSAVRDALRGGKAEPVNGVLTVSDLPGFAEAGGHIGLFVVNHQIRFRINLDAARQSGLQFSSKLLRLAEVIAQQSQLHRVMIGYSDNDKAAAARFARRLG